MSRKTKLNHAFGLVFGVFFLAARYCPSLGTRGARFILALRGMSPNISLTSCIAFCFLAMLILPAPSEAASIYSVTVGSGSCGGLTFTGSASTGQGLCDAVRVFDQNSQPLCTIPGTTSPGVWSGPGGGSCTIACVHNTDPGSCSVTVAFSLVTTGTPQTINFAGIASQLLSGSSLALSANASSGLPVSFETLTPQVCKVAGSVVSFSSLGTCTIVANQAGNATIQPAPLVSQSFSVVASLPSTTGAGDVPLPPWAYVLLALGLMGAMWRYQKPNWRT